MQSGNSEEKIHENFEKKLAQNTIYNFPNVHKKEVSLHWK